MVWERVSSILGSSRIAVTWTVPMDAPEGDYRIAHYGYYKKLFDGIIPYNGTSRVFKVLSGDFTPSLHGKEDMIGITLSLPVSLFLSINVIALFQVTGNIDTGAADDLLG